MERMAVLYGALADEIAAGREPPHVFAGDCCVIVGVLAGIQRRGIDPLLVFFDAHGDFNTWETTPSEFIGGMPLAMVTGRGDLRLVEACKLQPVPDGDLMLVDGRDLDPEEAAALRASGVAATPVAEVAAALPAGRPLYVHVDVDVVNPIDLPAVSYPAQGGPRLVEVVDAVAAIAATDQVVAFSMAMWNPALAEAYRSARATHLIAAPFLV
jgi:arginase